MKNAMKELNDLLEAYEKEKKDGRKKGRWYSSSVICSEVCGVGMFVCWTDQGRPGQSHQTEIWQLDTALTKVLRHFVW